MWVTLTSLYYNYCSNQPVNADESMWLFHAKTEVFHLPHIHCSDRSSQFQLWPSVRSVSSVAIGLFRAHFSDRVVIRLFLCRPHPIPHTNLQWTAEGGRFVSAESETVQHHRNKTRWFVLVQRHECPFCHMPMCSRSHLLSRVMQEGTLKGNSGKTLSNVERQILKFQGLCYPTMRMEAAYTFETPAT